MNYPALRKLLRLSRAKLQVVAGYSNQFFEKDDCRSAAQIANSGLEDRQTIWWAADSATANYYGLKFSEKVINIIGFSKSGLQNVEAPSLVFCFKLDFYNAK